MALAYFRYNLNKCLQTASEIMKTFISLLNNDSAANIIIKKGTLSMFTTDSCKMHREN